MYVAYNNKLSSYEEPLEKDESVSIHHRNIQSLATDIFQIKLSQSPEILTDIVTLTTQQHKQNQDFRIVVLQVSPM